MGPTPLCERLLEGDASCLAVLPQDAGRSLLCVGTYNNVSGTRTGALCFYDIMRDARSLEVRSRTHYTRPVLRQMTEAMFTDAS